MIHAIRELISWIKGEKELSKAEVKANLRKIPENEFVDKDYLRIIRNGNFDFIDDVRDIAREDYNSEENNE